MKFYFVNPDYLTYLQNIDPQIMDKNNPEYIRRKFVIGVVFEVNCINYFAPISSVKDFQLINSTTLHPKYTKTAFPIFTKEHDSYEISALIRLNYMFPVPANELERLDINRLPKDYRNFVQKEYNHCLKHYDDIKLLARNVYEQVINKVEQIEQYACSFQELETAHAIWIEKYMHVRKRI